MSVLNGIKFFVGMLPSFTRIGYQLRRLGWDTNIPDFNHQTWLVTGASEGIGASIAETAALAGAQVITVARSEEKMHTLKTRVAQKIARGDVRLRQNAQGGMIIPAQTDLSDMHAISRLVKQLRQKVKIDVLINNVGILNNNHTVTPQGFEMSYAVNLLGQFILTEALLRQGILARSPLIINMSSGGLYNQPLNTVLLNQTQDMFDGAMAYASHKRAQLALADYWRRAYAKLELFTYTMHPGWVRTSGVKKSLPLFDKLLNPVLRSPEQGADTAIWLAQRRPATREHAVWFDRKQRPTDPIVTSKIPIVSREDLITYLERDTEKLGINLDAA